LKIYLSKLHSGVHDFERPYSVITKVVFLDFDGVLLPDPDAHAQAQNGMNSSNYLSSVVFNPLCVSNLLHLLNKTGAEIVLSTSWADGHSLSDLSNCLMRNGIDPTLIFDYDDPGEKTYMTPRDPKYNRGEEVRAWLTEHTEIQQWVALDDNPSIMLLRERVVRTNPSRGFDRAALQKAMSFLT